MSGRERYLQYLKLFHDPSEASHVAFTELVTTLADEKNYDELEWILSILAYAYRGSHQKNESLLIYRYQIAFAGLSHDYSDLSLLNIDYQSELPARYMPGDYLAAHGVEAEEQAVDTLIYILAAQSYYFPLNDRENPVDQDCVCPRPRS